MLKQFSLVLTASLLFYGCKSQQKALPSQNSIKNNSKESKYKPYDELITKGAQTDPGLFTTHRIDDKLYLEIPDSLLGKDMLLVSRIAKVPAGYGGGYVNAGSKVNEQVIRWVKRGNKIDIKVISFENQSDQESPIHQSVEANNFYPILFSAEIKTFSKDSTGTVIDATDLFTQDIGAINAVSPRLRKEYKIKRLDASRTYIESAHAYPKNIEIKHVMTYDAEEPPERDQAETLTFLMNQSMILLPEDKMQPRIADPRVGWFTIKKYDYDSDALKSDDYQIIRRWKLVPKDIEAYKRGELVEPVKPIIYYLDPATPLKWRPYFKKGIEDWNKAFEGAGFKNAIIAKDPPTEEEDPEFSPEDIRYSVIRYVASTTRNAIGPSVSDPRTGEILESDVIWYHNHLRSYRNRFMIEAGAQNPAARTLETPEEEIGEMMRMVIAHEVGHAIGLPHNMKASSAYPTDSLRVASFTQKYGLTPSIMDYARVNYVAQPEDKGVRYIRMMGPYDHYAVNWGYRYLPEATSTEAEKETLDQWILEKAGNPWYEFGSSNGIDPNSQTESLGDDNIKASLYGLANLKEVVPSLIDWTTKEGYGYDDLQEVYRELNYLWRGYINHVITNVGGVYQTIKTADQDGVVYKPVPAKIQEDAITFLNKNAFNTPQWLLNPEILNRIESSGAIDQVKNIQTYALNRLLDDSRISRMIENVQANGTDAYSPVQLMTDLRTGIFSELYRSQKTDAYRRNLQRTYVDIATKYLKNLEAGENQDVLISDVLPLMRGELSRLRRDIAARKNNTSDVLTRYHYSDLIARIDAAFKTE